MSIKSKRYGLLRSEPEFPTPVPSVFVWFDPD